MHQRQRSWEKNQMAILKTKDLMNQIKSNSWKISKPDHTKKTEQLSLNIKYSQGKGRESKGGIKTVSRSSLTKRVFKYLKYREKKVESLFTEMTIENFPDHGKDTEIYIKD